MSTVASAPTVQQGRTVSPNVHMGLKIGAGALFAAFMLLVGLAAFTNRTLQTVVENGKTITRDQPNGTGQALMYAALGCFGASLAIAILTPAKAAQPAKKQSDVLELAAQKV
jgi:TRAP-type C4-dicarboxylate transport system permease small subunit